MSEQLGVSGLGPLDSVSVDRSRVNLGFVNLICT